jgi:hypothetical protein
MKIKYPDDIIRDRRQAIEVAGNLEIYRDGDEFVLELFKDEHSSYKKLSDALDEAATLILEGSSVDFVEFFQYEGVWRADMCALRADLYARRRHG